MRIWKKIFESVTNTIKTTSKDFTKTMMLTCKKNNKPLESLNKLLEIVNDRGMIASYLMPLLSKTTNLENVSQYKLVKDSNSSRVNDLLIQNSIPVSLYDNLLAVRDTVEVFELERDLLKMITNKKVNVDLASLWDQKLLFDFAKELHFNVKATGIKSTRDRTLIKLLKSRSIMFSASGVSKTRFYHLILMNSVID